MKWLSRWFSQKMPGVDKRPATQSAAPTCDYFVGRERELRQLSEWSSRTAQGEGQVWLIRGEQGMGKTALCECFLRQYIPADIQAKTVVAHGTCDEDMAGTVSLVPLTEALQSLMAAKSQTKQEWESLAEIVLVGIKHTPILGDVISAIENSSSLYQRCKGEEGEASPRKEEPLLTSPTTVYYDIATTLKNIAANHVLLLHIDNLQWCDRSTMEFLSFFCKRLGKLPIAVLLSYRESDVNTENSDLRKLFADIDHSGSAHTLTLDPLNSDEMENYLAHRFAPHRFPVSFVRQFVKTTGGVPLFFCEAARLLKEDGSVVYSDDHWQLSCDSDEIRIPNSVEAVVRERIRRVEENMGEDVKATLKQASVQGEMFFSHILYQLTVEIASWSEITIEDRLQKMANIHQIIQLLSEGEAAAGSSYKFVHTLYHKMLYGELSESQKRKLHKAVGEALEQSFSERLEEIAPQLIGHFTNGRVFAKVARYSYFAALKELRKYAYAEAVQYGRRGLEAFEKLAQLEEAEQLLEIQLHTLLGTAYAMQGKLHQAVQALNKAYTRAQECGEGQKLAELLLQMGQVKRELGNLQAAENHLAEGIRVCDKLSNRYWKIRLLAEQAAICLDRSRWQEAENIFLEASSLAQQEGNFRLHNRILFGFARLREKEGKWQQALDMYAQGVAFAHTSQDYLAEAQAVCGIARLYRKQGRWNESFGRYEKSLALFQESHYAEGEVEANLGIGLITLKQGNWSKALDIFTLSHNHYEEMGYWQGTAKSLNLIGYALRKLGRYEEARAYHEKALHVNEEVGNDEGRALCLEKMALIEMKYAHWDKSKQLLEEILDIWKKLSAKAGQSTALAHMGRLFARQNQFAEALQYLEQSLSMKEQIGDHEGKAYVLDDIGWVAFCRAHWEAAIKSCQESLKIRRDLGITGQQAVTLSLLGHVYRKQAQFAKAMEYYKVSYDINSKVGDIEGRALVLENIAISYLDHGRFAESLAKLQESLAIREELKDRPGIASLYSQLGKLYRKQGDYGEALTYLQKSLASHRDLMDQSGEAYVLNEIGRAHYLAGDYTAAWDCYNSSHRLREKLADVYGQGKTRNNMGEVLLRQNKPLEAMEQFALSLELKERICDMRGLVFTYADTAEAYCQLNRLDKAIENYQRALTDCGHIGDMAWCASMRKRLGELCQREGKHKEARQYYEEAIAYYQEHDATTAQCLAARLEELEDV
jgi:predicted ATPase